MKQHKVISVAGTDTFNAADYPSLKEELAAIADYTEGMLPLHKEDIVISYLKDHSIRMIWIDANPLLTAMVTSHVMPTATIEALFESSRNNLPFRKELEVFIRESLATES